MEKPRLADKSRESMERMPNWRVVEQFSEARNPQSDSEDGYLITDHCIAVLDGVSTPGQLTNRDELTPGEFAVRTTLNALADAKDLRAEDAVAYVTEALREACANDGIEGTPSFVFVAFFPKQNRIVRVGDCSFLIDGIGHNPGIAPDRAKAIMRKRMIEKQLLSGETVDALFEKEQLSNSSARDRMSKLRTWQQTYANNAEATDFGYGVVNGTDIPEKFIEYISVPPGAHSIVLASDGYPPSTLRNSLQETEAALRALEERDPLGIGDEPSVRSYRPREGQSAADDRTYIRIEA